MRENCIFCQIVEGKLPATKVYEDDDFVAFKDINPAAPVHILLIPRCHIVSMQDVTDDDSSWLGKMMALAPRLAAENGCRPGSEGGFRLVINSGADGGQERHHLHLHILGGARPWSNPRFGLE